MTRNKTDDRLVHDIRRRLDKPVVLIGLMGVGKTRLGRELAKKLDLDFVDSDHEIEKAAGMPVSDIFEMFGEDYFRDGEHRVLRRLVDDEIKIIATGGGAVIHPATADMLWDNTVTIWIRADIEVMVERTSRTNKRPLLARGDPAEILRDLAEKRYPVYDKADMVVDSYKGPVPNILADLLKALDAHLRSGS